MNTDTLTIARELEAKGVDHAAAEAIAAAIHNYTQSQMENLVTKTDLALAVRQLTVRMYSTGAVAVGVLVALDRLLPG